MTWSLDDFKNNHSISMDKKMPETEERRVSRPNMGQPNYKWLTEESDHQKLISIPKSMQMPKLER